MHLLLIEDEVATALYLKKGLSENGFVVTIANDGYVGEKLALTHTYELIILDLRLPKKSGLSILHKIRAQHSNLPVLVLTACDTVQERVNGLEQGADDYLIKPFAFIELVARIKNLLKRSECNPSDFVLRIADLTIDIEQHKVWRNNKKIYLSAKEFLLLTLLARRTGRVYTRTEISEKIWDINFDTETNVVDVAIRRLRQKVDDSFNPKLIYTVRGVGYVLELRE